MHLKVYCVQYIVLYLHHELYLHSGYYILYPLLLLYIPTCVPHTVRILYYISTPPLYAHICSEYSQDIIYLLLLVYMCSEYSQDIRLYYTSTTCLHVFCIYSGYYVILHIYYSLCSAYFLGIILNYMSATPCLYSYMCSAYILDIM